MCRCVAVLLLFCAWGAAAQNVVVDRDWLNIEFEGGGWDRESGVHVTVDGRREFVIECPIGGAPRQWAALDMRAFRGKTAVVEPKAPGTFERMKLHAAKMSDVPIVGAPRFAPRSQCRRPDVVLPRTSAGRFLLVPVRKSAPPVLCDFWDGTNCLFDLRVRLAVDGEPDFLASVPLDGFTSDTVRFSSDDPVVPAKAYESFTNRFALSATYPSDTREGRPTDRFTAPFGGSGDMVGFFSFGGRYHIGFLHDYVFDIWNENCCWSHASSADLVHWRLERPFDRKGKGVKRSSGCCFVDAENRSGLGDAKTPPILLFGCIEDNLAQRYQRNDGGEQTRPDLIPWLCMKYSPDGGETFVAYGRPIFRMQDIGGHDPEVVYHKPTDSFVMVVHDRRNRIWGFDFYTSKNLLDWEYASTVKGLWETPNFFPLRVDGTGEEKWVLMQCDLRYYVGSFDGRTFSPETALLGPFQTGCFAPRTLLTDDGRRILMAALLGSNPSGSGKGYCGNGGATAPVEVRLVSRADGLRLLGVRVQLKGN